MDANELMERYKRRLKEELENKHMDDTVPKVISYEYKQFKKAFLPKHLSIYEKACTFAEKAVKARPDAKRSAELLEAINITHLDITPTGAYSFAILVPLLMLITGGLLSFLIFQSLFMVIFFAMGSLSLIFAFQKLPEFLANNWRLKASNQMVQCIFFIVTYMRHTSNLERAVDFAADHVGAPLSLDLKKILWDVETGKFDTIKEAIDAYLETWKKYNREFIESFHLIESSLYEPGESRRLDVLDKALTVILTETYEKMLHYAHNLQGPVTMLHMLGIILPILGLVILPLVVSFMTSDTTSATTIAIYIAALYNVFLPIAVYYISKVVLSKRPTGYGQNDASPHESVKPVISPIFIAGMVFTVLFVIGVSPLLMHMVNADFDFQISNFDFLGYICPDKQLECDAADKIGPFGLGAGILSLFITLSIGLGAGAYYSLRSKNVIDVRERTKKLEDEFASALFQLGNRLGDNLPTEIAFGKVAEVMQGTASGDFFALVSNNITRMGMSVENAIFHPKAGAIIAYPSKIIQSSMKVLVESSKKGPRIAAQALVSMSRYIKEIHRVDERLKDLLADIISSMKSQIKVLTPAIAGIVVGITSMITSILISLGERITDLMQNTDTSMGDVSGFDFGTGIPTFYFQAIVGIYVVQITYIMVILSNGVENGADKMNEEYLLGRSMIGSTIIYVFISLAVILLFNMVATQIMSGLT